MYACITGASSGLGSEFARQLSLLGYDLILVARREDRLKSLACELKTNVIIMSYDLGIENNCYKLADSIKEYDVRLFVNNAGFGTCGAFTSTDINKELNMLDVNCRAVYILTKLMVKQMSEGIILNVASSAGLFPAGPYMAQYYATKAYVTSLSSGIECELKQAKSKLHIACLCPGPVDTEFNDVANVKFALKGISAEKCVRYALKKMKKKNIIVPGLYMRIATKSSKLARRDTIVRMTSHQQKKKM